MNRSKMAGLLSLCLAAGMVIPAMAKGDKDDNDMLHNSVQGAMVIPRAAGVGAALVVGTPIAIVRTTFDAWGDTTGKAADHVGGKDCGPCNLLASVYTVPLSMVIGATKGTYRGAANAFSGFNKPFTPSTFSMGDLKD